MTPSFWSVVRLVARREVVERAREKSFLVSTGLTLLIVLGVVVVPPLLGLGDAPVVLALPGSRRGEVERLAGRFGEALGLVAARRPGLRVVLPAAAPVADEPSVLPMALPASSWSTPRPYAGSVVVLVPLVEAVVISQFPRAP